MNARDIIDSLEAKRNHPAFRVGDTLKVSVKIHEGEKDRVQVFEGLVIKRRRNGKSGSFTVRKISYGIGVERVFAMQSPSIEKLEVVSRGKVRRARLFYLRGRKGKESQVDSTLNTDSKEEAPSKTETKAEKLEAAVGAQAAAIS